MATRWAIDNQYKGNAEKCAAEIASLGDAVTAKDVVAFAQDPTTELHKCFEWDNEKAAEKWREHTARNIIRALVYDHSDEETQETVSFRIFSRDSENKVYKQTLRMVTVENEYARLLEDAMRELEVFRRKYSQLVELESIIEEINIILTK